MRKRASPLEIYELLDKSNCGECGKEGCLQFAIALLERKITVDTCSHLSISSQRENLQKIQHLIMPPQHLITFGKSPHICKIGGEEVLYRHERTFFTPTAIAIEIHDNFAEAKEFHQICQYLNTLAITRVGEQLRIDAIALRYVSNNPQQYQQTAKLLTQLVDLPVILCCWDPQVIQTVVQAIAEYRPLVYAATPETLDKFAEIAKKFHVPIVCYADSLPVLAGMIRGLMEYGLNDLVIDSGSFLTPTELSATFNRFQEIRYRLFENNEDLWGFPLLGVPAAIWSQTHSFSSLQIENLLQYLSEEFTHIPQDKWLTQYAEILYGIMLESIDVNLLILHTGRSSDEIWGLLALLTFRQNLFTDPRVYPRVDPGLTVIGTPNEWSPVFLTSNYRMTKIPVEQDLVDAQLDSYLVVVDTDGIGIESATAGGQFNEHRIKEALDSTKVLERVRHRIIILPGMAARLRSPLEDLTKLEVWIGPRDSSAIPEYMNEHWNLDAVKAKYLED